jgi:predicted dehydrogenase
MLRIGIIGAARVAVYAMIAPAAASPRAAVTALAARDPARAADYARTHAIPRVLPDYDALFADPDIDLVYIATPPSTHADLALRAIAAGKAALVEKPFAMSEADAQRVRTSAEAAGVPVFEAMHSRHHRLHARLKALAAEIGPVRRADARFWITPPPEGDFRYDAALGGGALMDLGVYPLTWVRNLLGEDFAVESATMRGDGADLATEATLRFASGAIATIDARMDAEAFAISLGVEGERGRIDVLNPLAPQMGCRLTVTTPAGARDEPADGPGTFDAQLAAVCASLLDGAPWPLPADDYVQSMRAIDALRAAAR